MSKGIPDSRNGPENLIDQIADGEAPESTDTKVRYAAYASRLRTILASAHRYVAYTSDIGESFRPVAHPWLVRSAYGVSWLYITGDVAHESYKSYLRNQEYLHKPPPNLRPNSLESFSVGNHIGNPVNVPLKDDYRVVGVQRAIFQSVASMLFPALTIHSVVKYSGKAMKDVKNARLRTWGPIGLGLAVVPALPYIFDEPIEHAVEWAFEKGIEAYEKKEPRGSKGGEL
ncbi:hypothetical protein TWF106_003234 [Orbilia oligospora]|uniref:Mitochondrial fission process protein 1 n=1 Tax=Orbilia oligospora TaxID=2813651 RepID=A0A6G1MMJ8_ORBOL|nr:hypothetical protein TWF106_003234 [Orbilia oligospora]KAF3205050.1 hypothetical protein TWF679_009481 [Orbilia oligospora]KAF3206512.1 hypothetical protein TWF191_001406 [Orbilia oligospora]KAF3263661.1 hypothetical protein TWF192_005936 [Orbilia oligospora]